MCQKLTVLGSINVDHVISVPYFAKPGETLKGENYHLAFGGKGANQAVAAARLGAKTQFIGCVGDDAIGQRMKTAFAQDGIDISGIAEIAGETTGVAMIQVAASGENSIVISAGANNGLNEAYVEEYEDAIAQANLLLTQLETPLSAVQLAAEIARQNGTQVMLNPAPAQPLSDDFLILVDIITPNETEAEILTGIRVTDEASAAQAAAVFHQKGIGTVLITLGAKGVYLSQQGQGQVLQGFKVRAQDTTAAGDTFNGALATALLEGKPWLDAITFAQAAAALSVTRQGAQPSIPQRAEVLAFLQAQGR